MMPIVGLCIVVGIELGLAVAVLARNPRRAVNRWFAAYTGALAAWGTVNALFRLLPDPAVNLIVARAAFAAASLIAVTFFRFATVFPHRQPGSPGVLQAVTLTGLFVAGLAFSPWIVASVRLEGDTPQPVYGPLHLVFGVYFVVCYVWALVHLVGKLRRAKGFARAQLQYLFLGTGLACLGGVTTNLVVPLVFKTSRFNLYGPYFTAILVAFAAHAIIRYRLMDIRVVISRSAGYVAGWTTTSGIVVGGGIAISQLTLKNDPSPTGDLLLGLGAGFCAVLLAPRMRTLADRYLYRPAYDARQLVREGSRAMGTVTNPESVAAAMAAMIGRALKLESLAIVARDREREGFEPRVLQHVDPGATWPPPLTSGSPLVVELGRGTGALLADDLGRRPASDEVIAVGHDLRAWHAEVAVPVRSEGALIAMILAGPKLSGDPFFREDFELLETLASQLAVGLRNAQLYSEVVSIKEYHERILTHMESGVIAVREDGIVTTFNPAAERITGLSAGLAAGRPMAMLDPALQGVLADSLADRQDAETEISVGHPDGRVLPLVTHTSALHDRNGSVRGAIAVFNDHSRLKALEEDKRRADRLAAMGALATGIAHEIRNPLVAIKTFAELLPERADDQEFRSTFAKVAVREIHRIEELLARLRALAVPAVARLYPLDLAVPISETLDLLRGQADRRRVRVVTDVEPDLPAIRGEPDQLKQLFLNLFLNALEVMPDGGTLSVSVRADRGPKGRALVTVRVTDTGPGIPREDLPRVFEPFFTTKAHGTGLGLAICRGIADAHRAALWAEAGPAGAGTAFVIQLPALVDAPVAHGVLR
jgi:PAS domain S-box-containing protein